MRVNPKLIIKCLRASDHDFVWTAEFLGVHRSTAYRWWEKFAGLTDKRKLKRKSTRPQTIYRHEFSSKDRLDIETYRHKRHPTAERIVAKLNLTVSSRTVHRFLKRKGLVRKYRYYRRPKWQNTVHMHAKNTPTVGYLQFDVKYITPELSGLPWTCFEYAVIDIFSRYKEAVILNHLDQDGSMAAILEILPKLPFKPVFVQTDNGLEFQGRFHQMCLDMDLNHHLIHKNSPNENAIVERSFRTDEEEFFFMLEKAPAHYDQLRDWFAEWLHEYNYERPHLSLELKTPYQIVANVLSE